MSTDRKLFFKLNPTVGSSTRAGLVRQLKQEGATSVRRLFPRSKEPALAATYVADSGTPAASRAVARLLRSSKLVRYVQKGATRRPL